MSNHESLAEIIPLPIVMTAQPTEDLNRPEKTMRVRQSLSEYVERVEDFNSYATTEEALEVVAQAGLARSIATLINTRSSVIRGLIHPGQTSLRGNTDSWKLKATNDPNINRGITVSSRQLFLSHQPAKYDLILSAYRYGFMYTKEEIGDDQAHVYTLTESSVPENASGFLRISSLLVERLLEVTS